MQTLKVVNDPAERAVKLNTECCLIITDNADQRSALIQVIEQHRKDYPDFKKATLRKQKESKNKVITRKQKLT